MSEPKPSIAPCHQCDTCPLEAPARKLIKELLRIKCATLGEANRLKMACDRFERILNGKD